MYRNKRRQYRCQVCAAFAEKNTTTFETSFFCATCSQKKGGRVSLCNKARGRELTCNQIWHQTWKNGDAIPKQFQKKIRFRKRKLKDVQSDDDDGSDE
ncbi:TPA: hypothetical protein N0F65_001548 [Lagenidium giganteum]|uniref:PiggyBac transposable element-derived protein 4 C-terminal zinc-ribbon domain-containing protein n=1 Tax=Lagenidium giganteum TaxID=4803 RepID=A0AAV2YHL6_9STRA|nr:TPA: hypothetical protein N0F65_001548 [Lagenidium giganteum]